MSKHEYICIYHDKCPDGFAAAWAVHKALGDEVEFVGGQHGRAMPDVKGKHVIMVDFSYSYEEISRAGRDAASVLILDHHKSAENNLRPFAISGTIQEARRAWDVARNEVGVICYFDMEFSGARLAWDFFHPEESVPALIEFVEDRDLWRHKLPFSKEVNQWIMSYEHAFSTFDYMVSVLEDDDTFARAVGEGQAILRSQNAIIEKTVSDGITTMKIGGIVMPVVNVPHALASDTADYMKSNSPVVATYVDLPQGRKISVRVRDDSDIDASVIASKYRGGGHMRAASFIAEPGWRGEE